jgi:hypothetical protein
LCWVRVSSFGFDGLNVIGYTLNLSKSGADVPKPRSLPEKFDRLRSFPGHHKVNIGIWIEAGIGCDRPRDDDPAELIEMTPIVLTFKSPIFVIALPSGTAMP